MFDKYLLSNVLRQADGGETAPVGDTKVVADVVAADKTAAPEKSTTPETPKTIAGAGVDAEGVGKVVHVDYPETWRQKWAGEDKEDLKTLERMTKPDDVWKAYKELRKRVSSGELKSQLPKDATPEQAAAWRKENGFPEKPDGYIEKLALPNGVILGEADKPIVADLASVALEGNIPVENFNKLVTKYFELQDKQMLARQDRDAEIQSASIEVLRDKWGRDYNSNLAAYANLADLHFGKDIRAELESARLPNGQLVGDDPRYIEAFAKIGRELYPNPTKLPAGATDAKGISSRKMELQKLMGDRASDYWRGPQSESLQAEYQEILRYEERTKQRSAA